MSVTLKIIIEIVLVLSVVGTGINFWLCQKSPKFLGDTLLNYIQIKTLYTLAKDNISSSNMESPPYGYELNIITWIRASVKTLDKVRNWLFVIIIIFGVISFLLGIVYWLIVCFAFFLSSFVKVSGSSARNIYDDILTIMNNVYHWNKENPEECKEHCMEKEPRMLKNIYMVITEAEN
ncbi:MAG: hypothetical protein PHN88_02715 [Ignavibacteria bacterium]|nr:hypothetical protein [Ignavibacteria bacterium]